MSYTCMSFGWYQELLAEACVPDLTAAETALIEMLDRGGMIVHAYRDTDPENPELVGRHFRLRAFIGAQESDRSPSFAPPHEIERFLIEAADLRAWSHASRSGGLIEERWRILDFWPAEQPARTYGKAVLIASTAALQSPAVYADHRRPHPVKAANQIP